MLYAAPGVIRKASATDVSQGGMQLLCTCGYCHVNQISYFSSTLIFAVDVC